MGAGTGTIDSTKVGTAGAAVAGVEVGAEAADTGEIITTGSWGLVSSPFSCDRASTAEAAGSVAGLAGDDEADGTDATLAGA